MSSANFSFHDVRFRRRGDDECDIVVHGRTVGTVTRRPDIASPDGGWYYVIHMYDDCRGPKQVDHRAQVRGTVAAMLTERDLVPWTPPPVHPDFASHGHRHA